MIWCSIPVERRVAPSHGEPHSMSTIITQDDTEIYYKDWGEGSTPAGEIKKTGHPCSRARDRALVGLGGYVVCFRQFAALFTGELVVDYVRHYAAHA